MATRPGVAGPERTAEDIGNPATVQAYRPAAMPRMTPVARLISR